MSALEEIVTSVFGDLVDAEAVAKMGPDTSSVHVPGQLRAVRRRRPVAKRDIHQEPSDLKRNIALATNAGGVIAAPAALYAATRSARRNEGGVSRDIGRAVARRNPGGRVARVVNTLDNKVGRKGRIGAALAGGTAIALQSANGIGDAIAAQEMNRQRLVAAERKKTVASKGARLQALRSGRLHSVFETLGMGGRHGPGAGAPRGRHVAPRGRHIAPPGSAAPAAAAAAPTAPFVPKPASAKTAGSGFFGNDRNKLAALAGAGVLTYRQGHSAGREQAYYGKAHVGEVEIAGTFSKFDVDKQRAYGWASVVSLDGEPVIDRQGDYIGLDDIEEAAYTYVRKSRVAGDMHRRTHDDQPHKAGELIESVVFTPDKCHAMGLPASFAGKWWMGVQVEDPAVWAEVKKGNRTGFSIHGRGLRKDTTLDEIRSS